MGSFSYTIRNSQNDTHQNIVDGEKVYIKYGNDIVHGVYCDYGRFEIPYNVNGQVKKLDVDIHALEGYISENNCTMNEAIDVIGEWYEDNEEKFGKIHHLGKIGCDEHQRLRCVSIRNFHRNNPPRFTYVKLSKIKSHFDYVENSSDPHQGFYKWRVKANEEPSMW